MDLLILLQLLYLYKLLVEAVVEVGREAEVAVELVLIIIIHLILSIGEHRTAYP
jgi:hypothetical protein